MGEAPGKFIDQFQYVEEESEMMLSTKITQLIQIIFVSIQKIIRILANKLFFRMKCLKFETKGTKKNQCAFGSFVTQLFKFLVLSTLCIWTTGTHLWYIFLSGMKFFVITDDL